MTVPKQMNAGVELLLKRMETNPEEFYTDDPYPIGRGAKWDALIQRFKHHLSPEDRDALNAGFDSIMQQKFTEIVLEGLVDPKPLTNLEQLLQVKQNATLSAGTTLGGYLGAGTITLGNQTLDESTVEHMKAHLEALKVKDRDALVNKKPTTIFGKLFNYL